MHYTLINKNEIIPKIINGGIDLLTVLRRDTVDKNSNYCKNTYIIKYLDTDNILCVYFSHNNKLYIATDNDIIEYLTIKKLNKEQIFENIYKFLENNTNNVNTNNVNTNNVNTNNVNTDNVNSDNVNSDNLNMNIEINPIIDLIENENINENEKEKNVNEFEKINILDQCEQMYKMYENEKNRKKKLEEELKIEEKNEKELLKKKRHMLQEKIITLKGNYRTYKNIEGDKLKNSNFNIPETFKMQYEYFDKMLDIDKKTIDNIDDLEIMNSENYNEDITLLSLNFHEKIKEFKEKLTFSHNWSELDNEFKTGSYSMGYNK